MVNISPTPQHVTTQLISFVGAVLEDKTETIPAGATVWPISRVAIAESGVLARCKFTLNKPKVRAAIAVFKNNGNGSVALLLDMR